MAGIMRDTPRLIDGVDLRVTEQCLVMIGIKE
jgi:hypothetical protein